MVRLALYLAAGFGICSGLYGGAVWNGADTIMAQILAALLMAGGTLAMLAGIGFAALLDAAARVERKLDGLGARDDG